MLNLLRVNIRQFDEESQEEDFSKYIGQDGELDIDSLVNDYKEPETNPDNDKLDTNDDKSQDEFSEQTETETETSEKVEGDPASETSEPEEKEKRTPDQAFAEMRRQVEQYAPVAKWVEDLAKQQGFSDPQELINAYQKQQLAKEAEAKGVPVDVYERLHTLEQENKQKDELMFREKFNAEVQATKEKYTLNDDQITEVFRFMGQRGYIDENGKATIPFEDAYTLANRDTLIQQAEERARQQYLEEKQKLQQQATPNAGTHSKDAKTTADDMLDINPLDMLKKMGIDYD